jgi:hypothetical protein
MSGKADKDSRDDKFRLIDLIVILFCLFGAGISLNLFRLDLFRTLDSKNGNPIGTIVIKNNIAQRRIADRVLWDRLSIE